MTDEIIRAPQSPLQIPESPSPDDDSIFHLPDEIRDNERLTRVYNDMVAGLRSEAQDIPMTTVQHLLIERIASMYVIIKHHDEAGTWLPRQQRDYNQQWLAMAAEFNKLLLASQEMRYTATMGKIEGAITAAVNRLPDPEMRQKMKEFMLDEFQKAGL